ncbi:MAG: TonB-dependent receptor [Arenicella sp.]|nr:TonB-dependent receptor [Arenicella sp.]
MKKYLNLSIVCLSANLIISTHASAEIKGTAALEEVVVRAHLLSDQGLSQSTDVLSGDELFEQLQGSLGETLANVPGVRNASFGGAVGRPVIHGLGGARVKTTEDRIDSLDVSVTSADHAVTVEPFIANRITILKGASTLLYGSGAIGGVVDTETGRIPKRLPEASLTGRAEARFADNADAETLAIRLDGKTTESIAWHLDAFSKQADDYEISAPADSGEQGGASTLEGSRYDVSGGAFGASFIGEAGFIGLSISTLDANYGLVGPHAEHEEHDGDTGDHADGHDQESFEQDEEQPGVIELEQTRIDLEAERIAPFSGIEKINFRLGINDYQHSEIEGNGELGTVFDNRAWEGRIEVSHLPIASFKGAFGLQLNGREFSALGEEAFVPPVDSDSAGLFWVGEREFDKWSLETGVRLDRVEHSPSPVGLANVDFSTLSSSLGAVIPASESLSWSALLDYTERAPAIEELYSNGAHLATQTFEIGDTNLQKESALGLSFSAHYHTDLVDLNATIYATQFDDFIYQTNTGDIEDDLPVLRYQQGDADFVGIDFEVAFHLSKFLGGDLDLTATFDSVSADVKSRASGEQSLPRIPADSQSLGVSWDNDVWRAKLNFKQVSSQTDVANFELTTDSYTDLTLTINRRIGLAVGDVDLFIHGRNLGDQEQRQHTSFVKDFAPAPGRRIEVGARFQV